MFLFALHSRAPQFCPFWSQGGAIGGLAYALDRSKAVQVQIEQEAAEEREIEETWRPENVLNYLQLDRIELEIGYGLIPLVDAEQDGDLLERVTLIRRQMAMELGLVIPPVRIRDNLQLAPGASFHQDQRGGGRSRGTDAQSLLVHGFRAVAEPVQGIETREPALGCRPMGISGKASGGGSGWIYRCRSAFSTGNPLDWRSLGGMPMNLSGARK